jgi:carboxymethylenebutenolidase
VEFAASLSVLPVHLAARVGGRLDRMNIELGASDGHAFTAYVTRPDSKATKAIVVIQEIFGVNSHIRSVADGYARDGFLAIAPALFDRAKRGIELGYGPEDMQRGISIATKVGMEQPLLDLAAAIEWAASEVGATHVGVVGFCWGGSLAWLSATRLNVAAAVGYYGGRIAQFAAEQPRCPVMLHFGAKDAHIAHTEIDKIRHAHPKVPIYLYDAGHGFNCDQRKDYDPDSAGLARKRTLAFLQEKL